MAIERIYNALQNGDRYGNPVWNVTFPYFRTVLYKYTNRGRDYIGFSHFGSSAVENTPEKLEWVIRNIFDMTPERFEKEYISFDTLKGITA